MFRKELKNNVKNELLCYGKIISNIQSLIRAFIEVNNKLYERVIKKKFNNLRKKNKTYTGYLAYNKRVLRKGIKNNRFKNSNYIKLIPIKLNFI